MTMAEKLASSIGKGLVAGPIGTASMTVSSTVEARIRQRKASSAPARATAKVLGITSVLHPAARRAPRSADPGGAHPADRARRHHKRLLVGPRWWRRARDLAWSYDFPARQLLPIAGMVAFYNEKVDIFLDGQRLERPQTHFFSSDDNRTAHSPQEPKAHEPSGTSIRLRHVHP
jgi:hypothetical protein